MSIPTRPRLHETLAYADSVTPMPGVQKEAVLTAFTDEIVRLRERVSALESSVADLTHMCISLRDELRAVRDAQSAQKSVVYVSRANWEDDVWAREDRPRSRR
jgi:hypothetical protein